jgi:hypothetical protein
MGGGLMQLVAYGAQDVYLTGSPQITFFKVIYRRHTNFSVEPIPQTFTGTADFGRTVTCTINRNGDLITNMYALINLRAAAADVDQEWGYVRRVGLAILQHYKIEIGGSKIDEQYGDWLNIWWELSHKVGQERGFARMVGDVPELTTINSTDKPSYTLYVPLQFWFNRNNGLALPLIALQYHDVRVTIDFRPSVQCVNKVNKYKSEPTVGMTDASLVIDYVYLDSEERKRFAQASHEYLIEQLQFTGSETLSSTNNKYRLNFNHPCKFLVWAPHLEKYATRTTFAAYDSNWDEAEVLERFAKLMWLATRKNLALVPEAPATSTTDVVPAHYEIDDADASQSEVTSPDATDAAKTAKIFNYVTAQVVFNIADVHTGSTNTVNASVENVVLLSNNFTMADLSMDVSSLASSYGASEAFLTFHGVDVQDQFNYGNYIDGTNNPVSAAKLQLNGSDRFQERDGYYFNYVQPFQHFSNTPADGINVYSFALKPEDHQPSGTCNFSRIDNATLQVKVGLDNQAGDNNYTTDYIGSNSNSLLNIYAVNYNVLRVMSGMAGAAYSN